jgi:hypothetical protein
MGTSTSMSTLMRGSSGKAASKWTEKTHYLVVPDRGSASGLQRRHLPYGSPMVPERHFWAGCDYELGRVCA